MSTEGTRLGFTVAIAVILCLTALTGAGLVEAMEHFGAPGWFAGAASCVVVVLLLWVVNDALEARDRRPG